MKFLDAAGSRMVTPSWVAKAQLTKKEDNNERKEEKK
jgi:hypothetical protein